MDKKDALTSSRVGFIGAGFKPGDIIHWPGGPGNESPGNYVVLKVENTSLVIRGLGFWEGVKYYFCRLMVWAGAVQRRVVVGYNKLTRRPR